MQNYFIPAEYINVENIKKFISSMGEAKLLQLKLVPVEIPISPQTPCQQSLVLSLRSTLEILCRFPVVLHNLNRSFSEN